MTRDMLVQIAGFAAAGLTLTAFSLRTIIPMRVAAIGANLAFIVYGLLGNLIPPLVLHLVLLPINTLRLRQMLRLIRQVREAARADFDIAWLRPFMRTRSTGAGEVIFSRGEAADAVFYVVEGTFRLREIDRPVEPGDVIGEIGLVAHGNRRTQTLVCDAPGILLTIGYEEVRRLYFQNPLFGFYLLKLIGARLTADIRRLEAGGERPMALGTAPGAPA